MAKKPNGNGAAKAAEPEILPDDTSKAGEAAADAAKLAQPDPKADGQVEGAVDENAAAAAKLIQPQPTQEVAAPAPRRGPKPGDRVTFRLGEGERPLNGKRQFDATVLGLGDGDRLDLKVHYGATAGDGYRQAVPKGDAPGCWSAGS